MRKIRVSAFKKIANWHVYYGRKVEREEANIIISYTLESL